MAKILIAGIGSGKKEEGRYKEANYQLKEKIYKNRTFVTSAIEEYFDIDKTIYIGTTGSMWDNLYEHYCKKFDKKFDNNYYEELWEIVSSSNKDTEIFKLNIDKFNEIFEGKIVGKITKYGLNEAEIFENFNIIMDLDQYLNNGDEVYIDITHSFRSNAMWMFMVINYIKDVIDKNIEIKMISYGMYEANEKIDDYNITPIVDLNAFYILLKWIKGAQSLKDYGNFYPLENLIEETEINKKMLNFSNAMNMNYIGSIKQSIDSLKRDNIVSKIENLQGPAKLLIPSIVKDFIKEFDGLEKDYEIQLKLAKWHYSQKRYAMAFINMNEAIRNFVALSLNVLKTSEETEENTASDWLYKVRKKIERDKMKKSDSTKKFNDKKYTPIKELVSIFETSRKVRNKIAHSEGEDSSAKNHIDNLENYCDKLEKIMTEKNLKIIKDFENEFNILKK